MGYKVNGKEVETDGDWMECPECDNPHCPLLRWMSYCPCCRTKLDIEED